MSLENRIAKCDLCQDLQQEKVFGVGWPGWAIIQGIGAAPPDPNKPISPENTEFYLCVSCKQDVAQYLVKRKIELRGI